MNNSSDIILGLILLTIIAFIICKKGHHYIKVMSDYAIFTGRSRRNEYWYFTLINCILGPFTTFLDNILGTTIGTTPYGVLYWSYSLIIILPGIAVNIRRLHDIGRSGWFCLINLIPIIGNIWYLFLMCTDSEPRDNEYGENPKKSEYQTIDSEHFYCSEKKGNYFCPKCSKPYTPNKSKIFCTDCGCKL